MRHDSLVTDLSARILCYIKHWSSVTSIFLFLRFSALFTQLSKEAVKVSYDSFARYPVYIICTFSEIIHILFEEYANTREIVYNNYRDRIMYRKHHTASSRLSQCHWIAPYWKHSERANDLSQRLAQAQAYFSSRIHFCELPEISDSRSEFK